MRAVINLVGQRFTRLVVIRQAGKDGHGKILWECRCDCGTTCIVRGSKLKLEHTRSCGCLRRVGVTTHGRSHGDYLYDTYDGIKSRCYIETSKRYSGYGGRGITMCPAWIDNPSLFIAYVLAELGERPSKHSLDRIDNNAGYFPGNLRWATIAEQGNNKRNNVLLTYQGETKTIAQWAIELGMNYQTMRNRHNRGWEVSRIFETPAKQSQLSSRKA